MGGGRHRERHGIDQKEGPMKNKEKSMDEEMRRQVAKMLLALIKQCVQDTCDTAEKTRAAADAARALRELYEV